MKILKTLNFIRGNPLKLLSIKKRGYFRMNWIKAINLDQLGKEEREHLRFWIEAEKLLDEAEKLLKEKHD